MLTSEAMSAGYQKIQRECPTLPGPGVQFVLCAAAKLTSIWIFLIVSTILLATHRNLWNLRSSGSHERSILFPLGNNGYKFVRCGNGLAARVCLLAIYSLVKKCWFIIEQPQGSCAQLHPRLAELLRLYEIFMTGIWGGKYGIEGTPKRHWLYSNNRPVLQRLSALAGHMTQEECQTLQGGSLVKRSRRPDGSWVWSGDKSKMTASQMLCQKLPEQFHELYIFIIYIYICTYIL